MSFPHSDTKHELNTVYVIGAPPVLWEGGYTVKHTPSILGMKNGLDLEVIQEGRVDIRWIYPA